jgi:hypothetical protein
MPMPTAPVTGAAGLDPFVAAEASRPIVISKVPSAPAPSSAPATHSLRTITSQPAAHTAAMAHTAARNSSQRPA